MIDAYSGNKAEIYVLKYKESRNKRWIFILKLM